MDLFSDGDIPGRQFHKEMELLPGIPRDFYEVFWGSLWYLAMNFFYFKLIACVYLDYQIIRVLHIKKVSMSR